MPTLLSISESTVRRRVARVLRTSIQQTKFVPSNATQDLKRWLLGLELTLVERRVVESQIRNMLQEYERRCRWIQTELNQDVFHRFGGD